MFIIKERERKKKKKQEDLNVKKFYIGDFQKSHKIFKVARTFALLPFYFDGH
jgi:hypothetical protein